MVLHVLCVLASAFTLFLIQPLMAKRLLPEFGGGASVWAVCLAFYQALLLLGYVYSHWLAQRRSLRQQALIHLAVIAAGCGALLWPVATAHLGLSPEVAILVALSQSIGLPYFLLSTSSPLIQHWHATLLPGRRAYRLFAWSNVACAVALLTFPLVLERRWTLTGIERLWKAAFIATAVLLTALAIRVMSKRNGLEPPAAETQDGTPSMSQVRAWLGYSFLGSVLLVAVTNQLCQVVAPFPFLWIVPLLLYLATFAVCFEWRGYRPAIGTYAGMAGVILIAVAAKLLPASKITDPGIVLWLAGLFSTCLFFHGELAYRKPAERHLTTFYIAMAAGGALGSVFVAFLAPLLFPGFWELPLVMAAGAALLFLRVKAEQRVAYYARSAMLVIVAPVAMALVGDVVSGSVDFGRNFYGILRVADETDAGARVRVLQHGSVMHGRQFLDAAKRDVPTAYYSRLSGAGQVLDRAATPRRIGVIGLGVGTLAAYGRPGDRMVFYEINPMVEKMAREHFTYLRDSRAQVEVRTGDARLLLHEEPPRNYDVLVIDAFSGDAIPVHLLTREALQLYRKHLSEDGVMLLHISNYNLDLEPVVRSLAADAGLSMVTIDSGSDERIAAAIARWVVLGPAQAVRKASPSGTMAEPRVEARYLWTDEWSSLLTVIR